MRTMVTGTFDQIVDLSEGNTTGVTGYVLRTHQ
jgi:hypothetical protein